MAETLTPDDIAALNKYGQSRGLSLANAPAPTPSAGGLSPEDVAALNAFGKSKGLTLANTEPEHTDIGNRIASAAEDLQSCRGEYSGMCQRYARTSVEKATGKSDLFGVPLHQNSARDAMDAFFGKGIGFKFDGSPLQPGDIAYSGRMGGKFGHAMVAGNDGRVRSNLGVGVGQDKIDWVVRPGAPRGGANTPPLPTMPSRQAVATPPPPGAPDTVVPGVGRITHRNGRPVYLNTNGKPYKSSAEWRAAQRKAYGDKTPPRMVDGHAMTGAMQVPEGTAPSTSITGQLGAAWKQVYEDPGASIAKGMHQSAEQSRIGAGVYKNASGGLDVVDPSTAREHARDANAQDATGEWLQGSPKVFRNLEQGTEGLGAMAAAALSALDAQDSAASATDPKEKAMWQDRAHKYAALANSMAKPMVESIKHPVKALSDGDKTWIEHALDLGMMVDMGRGGVKAVAKLAKKAPTPTPAEVDAASPVEGAAPAEPATPQMPHHSTVQARADTGKFTTASPEEQLAALDWKPAKGKGGVAAWQSPQGDATIVKLKKGYVLRMEGHPDAGPFATPGKALLTRHEQAMQAPTEPPAPPRVAPAMPPSETAIGLRQHHEAMAALNQADNELHAAPPEAPPTVAPTTPKVMPAAGEVPPTAVEVAKPPAVEAVPSPEVAPDAPVGSHGMRMADLEHTAADLGIDLPDRNLFKRSWEETKNHANDRFVEIVNDMGFTDAKAVRPGQGGMTEEQYYVGHTVLRNLTDHVVPDTLKKLEAADPASPEYKELQARLDAAMNDTDTLSKKLYKAGSDAGRRLAFQKAVVTGPFDTASILKRAQAATNGKLSGSATLSITRSVQRAKTIEGRIRATSAERAEAALKKLEGTDLSKLLPTDLGRCA